MPRKFLLIDLIFFVVVFVTSTNGHLRLTFPIPRQLSTDFMHQNMPCGNTAKHLQSFPLKPKSLYKITWVVTQYVPGPIVLELLNSEGELIHKITETGCTNGSMHIQSYYWTVPDNLTCQDCIIRLRQKMVDFHGQDYGIVSCADVSIDKNYKLLCYNRGYPVNGSCLCRQLYRGDFCQYENECEDQEDCGGGKRGSCRQYSRTYFPQKMCFCHHGFYMSKCSVRSEMERFNFNPKNALEEKKYQSLTLCENCPLKLWWKILEDSCEIEFVAMGPVNSQIGLGWRWTNFTTLCRNFPFYRSIRPNDPQIPYLDPFECLDLVTGMAHGNSHRVDDRYAATSFESPELDSFYGGSSADLTSALGTESLDHVIIIFRKRIGEANYLPHPLASAGRFSRDFGEPDYDIYEFINQQNLDSNGTEENKFEKRAQGDYEEIEEEEDVPTLFSRRSDPFDIPITNGYMHLAWGIYPEIRGYKFNFAMIESELKGYTTVDLCEGKCDSCQIKKGIKEQERKPIFDQFSLDELRNELSVNESKDIYRNLYERNAGKSNFSRKSSKIQDEGNNTYNETYNNLTTRESKIKTYIFDKSGFPNVAINNITEFSEKIAEEIMGTTVSKSTSTIDKISTITNLINNTGYKLLKLNTDNPLDQEQDSFVRETVKLLQQFTNFNSSSKIYKLFVSPAEGLIQDKLETPQTKTQLVAGPDKFIKTKKSIKQESGIIDQISNLTIFEGNNKTSTTTPFNKTLNVRVKLIPINISTDMFKTNLTKSSIIDKSTSSVLLWNFSTTPHNDINSTQTSNVLNETRKDISNDSQEQITLTSTTIYNVTNYFETTMSNTNKFNTTNISTTTIKQAQLIEKSNNNTIKEISTMEPFNQTNNNLNKYPIVEHLAIVNSSTLSSLETDSEIRSNISTPAINISEGPFVTQLHLNLKINVETENILKELPKNSSITTPLNVNLINSTLVNITTTTTSITTFFNNTNLTLTTTYVSLNFSAL